MKPGSVQSASQVTAWISPANAEPRLKEGFVELGFSAAPGEYVLTQDRRSARLYLESLAVAGERGTLEDRMGDSVARGRVRAKTGFIDGTSALSGVAQALDGRHFVFSILVNYPDSGGLNKSVWKPMQDELCERLVEAVKGK